MTRIYALSGGQTLLLAGKVLVPSSVTPIWKRENCVMKVWASFSSCMLCPSQFSISVDHQKSFVLAAGLGFSCWETVAWPGCIT